MLHSGLIMPLQPHYHYVYRYRTTAHTSASAGGPTTVELAAQLSMQTFALRADNTTENNRVGAILTLSAPHFFYTTSQGGSAAGQQHDDAEEALARAPAVVTFEADGRVASLALDLHEPLWVANIKRALVSLLQLQSPRPDELVQDGQLNLGMADTLTYNRTEHDLVGADCRVQHQLQIGVDYVRIHKRRSPAQDCGWHNIHHGRTHQADRSRLSHGYEGDITTRHYFNATSRHLVKVRFDDRHAAALQGDRRQLVKASSTGYLSLVEATAALGDQQELPQTFSALVDLASGVSGSAVCSNFGFCHSHDLPHKL